MATREEELQELAELEELAQLDALADQEASEWSPEQNYAPSEGEMMEANAKHDPTTGEAMSAGVIEGVPFLKDGIAAVDGISAAVNEGQSFGEAYGNYKEELELKAIDSGAEDIYEHDNGIDIYSDNNKITNNDNIRFHYLSYQELIIRLSKEYNDTHKEYTKYITNRYL